MSNGQFAISQSRSRSRHQIRRDTGGICLPCQHDASASTAEWLVAGPYFEGSPTCAMIDFGNNLTLYDHKAFPIRIRGCIGIRGYVMNNVLQGRVGKLSCHSDNHTLGCGSRSHRLRGMWSRTAHHQKRDEDRSNVAHWQLTIEICCVSQDRPAARNNQGKQHGSESKEQSPINRRKHINFIECLGFAFNSR